jgi:hypothetical protein
MRGVAITTFIITEYDIIDELLFIKNMHSMKYEIYVKQQDFLMQKAYVEERV